jgi:predicted phage baseplate assembly protein
MALPVPNLDDLQFQRDLVDEARLRIIRYCPEWTEYNVSDPGITLIELFAWMTEMIVYRLNKVPDKNYVKFLDMVGVELMPAASAEADLTFRLSAPFPLSAENNNPAVVPSGLEVATNAMGDAPEVIFTTTEPLLINGPVLSQLRGDEFHKNYLPRLGIEIFPVFGAGRPQTGATFYLGFEDSNNIAGHILRLVFECERTEAVGIRREDPPLVWECSLGDGIWEEILPSNLEGEKDTTGGLNNERGEITFYLPRSLRPDQVYGRNAYWLRCRFEPRRPEQGRYTESPRVRNVQAFALGATTTAINAVFNYFEDLGTSNGDPGQSYQLAFSPVLDLHEDETVEVEEIRDGLLAYVPWQRVKDFSKSDRFDRHFVLETATGQIHFGPSIRQPDGSVRQYGRVPEVGRRVRITKYRYGGGVAGNVPTGRISVMRSAVPYIDRVTNMRRATGGRDQETLEEAKERARREMRAQYRAVTAEDFENLALSAGREIARVKCLAPSTTDSALPPGMVELLVVPAVADAVFAGDLSRLQLTERTINRVQQYLDEYRLLTTMLRVREPKYVGVKVRAEIVVSEHIRPEVVLGRVAEVLRQYLSPLTPSGQNLLPEGVVEPNWQGWPFGRSLYVAELYSVIQQVPGVKHVLDVQIRQRPVLPNKEAPPLGQLEDFAGTAAGNLAGASGQDNTLNLVTGKVLLVAADTLLCSLEHEVELVEL